MPTNDFFSFTKKNDFVRILDVVCASILHKFMKNMPQTQTVSLINEATTSVTHALRSRYVAIFSRCIQKNDHFRKCFFLFSRFFYGALKNANIPLESLDFGSTNLRKNASNTAKLFESGNWHVRYASVTLASHRHF